MGNGTFLLLDYFDTLVPKARNGVLCQTHSSLKFTSGKNLEGEKIDIALKFVHFKERSLFSGI